MERAIETFLWNGMDKRGGRAHTMVVRDGKITESDVYESTDSQSHSHGERYVPEFQEAAPNVVVYMDKTPCVKCAEYLFEKYKGSSEKKPTIYASYLFSYFDTAESKKESQAALEILHENGFNICPVDISEFLPFLDKDYHEVIAIVANTDRFKKGQQQLQEYLKNTCS